MTEKEVSQDRWQVFRKQVSKLSRPVVTLSSVAAVTIIVANITSTVLV